jgi:hypothetical protein
MPPGPKSTAGKKKKEGVDGEHKSPTPATINLTDDDTEMTDAGDTTASPASASHQPQFLETWHTTSPPPESVSGGSTPRRHGRGSTTSPAFSDFSSPASTPTSSTFMTPVSNFYPSTSSTPVSGSGIEKLSVSQTETVDQQS